MSLSQCHLQAHKTWLSFKIILCPASQIVKIKGDFKEQVCLLAPNLYKLFQQAQLSWQKLLFCFVLLNLFLFIKVLVIFFLISCFKANAAKQLLFSIHIYIYNDSQLLFSFFFFFFLFQPTGSCWINVRFVLHNLLHNS